MTDHDPEMVLELEGVSKLYPGTDVPAVNDIHLAVRRGEFVTFLGPSGSGKTTTLNMIAGFVSVTSGRILIDGRDIADVKPHKRNLGMVFQNYGLFPHMSVWDNIAFPLVERKVTKASIREKVEAALEMVELTGLERRRPRDLSGGQQQRVALARALVFDPPVLLMDEPLGALDKKLRQQLQLEIKRVHRELGITFLFVTHDQEEAMTLSDTVAVFDSGEIRQVGTPDQLYRCPESRFVAEFLGDSNIIEGELCREGEVWRLDTADGVIQLDDWKAPEGVREGRACVMFRPEDMFLVEDAQRIDAWRGTVREVVYLGSEQRVIVRSESGRDLTVRLVGESVQRRPEVGATVGVGYSTGNAWLISADA